MAKSTSRLGRGLSALIDAPITGAEPLDLQAENRHSEHAGVQEIRLDRIRRNPQQPRTSFDERSLHQLADSIRKSGVLQPIIVKPLPEGFYQLVAGERRYRAAKIAFLETIPAVVRDVSDALALELALIENLQREDLAPLERARAYEHYVATFGVSIEELADRISESRASVSNYMRLLKLTPAVLELMTSGELGMGQARALVTIEDPQRQLALARMAVTRNLSVRQVEALVRGQEVGERARESDGDRADARPSATRHFAELELALTRAAGVRVRLRPGRKKNAGQIIVHYGSLEEFERISRMLGAPPHAD